MKPHQKTRNTHKFKAGGVSSKPCYKWRGGERWSQERRSETKLEEWNTSRRGLKETEAED